LYPTSAILSTWSERDWRSAEGVQLETLDQMQRLMVRTYQHAYEIFVRVGATGDVLVRGGRVFQKFTEARILGSSLGGGFLKQRGIYVGLRLEFYLDGETIVTAPILSISVCPAEVAASA
jgi:hypothetical protein